MIREDDEACESQEEQLGKASDHSKDTSQDKKQRTKIYEGTKVDRELNGSRTIAINRPVTENSRSVCLGGDRTQKTVFCVTDRTTLSIDRFVGARPVLLRG